MAAPGAEHDYFADLIERQDGSQGAKAGEPDLMFSEEPPVLSMQSTNDPAMPSPGLPALDIEEAKSATPNGPSLKPMGEGLGKRQARETQEIVETVMGRFASGLQAVLEHTNRRLEALEERTDNLNQLVVDLGKSIEANTRAAQEQNASIERSFRELARGIQLIRDKQELAETHAELAEFRPELRHGSIGAASELAPSPAASIAPAPAPASAPVQPTAVEQAATLPAPPPPVNTAPSAPSAPPASAPPAPQPAPVPQPAAPQASAPVQPQYAAPQQQPQAQQQAPQPAAELQPQYSAPLPPQAPSPVQQQQLPPQPQPQAPAPPQLQQPQQPQQQAPLYQPAAPQPVQSMPPPQQYASSPHAGGQYPGAPPPPQQQQYSAPPLPPASAGYTRPQEPPAGAPYQGPPAQQQHQAMYLPPPRPLAPTPPPQHSYEQVAPPPQQAQYAPQPPLPPRAPGPPQGLWRGPQPDPYSRPPPASPAGGGRPQAQAPQARDVPLERVIDEVASMGFSRHEVRETVVQLMNSGKTVDLNVVLDRLMNRDR